MRADNGEFGRVTGVVWVLVSAESRPFRTTDAGAAVRDRAGNAIAAIGVSVASDLDVETIGSDALRTAGELSTALVEYMPSQPARSPSR